jgi:hypothetical protein
MSHPQGQERTPTILGFDGLLARQPEHLAECLTAGVSI